MLVGRLLEGFPEADPRFLRGGGGGGGGGGRRFDQITVLYLFGKSGLSRTRRLIRVYTVLPLIQHFYIHSKEVSNKILYNEELRI